MLKSVIFCEIVDFCFHGPLKSDTQILDLGELLRDHRCGRKMDVFHGQDGADSSVIVLFVIIWFENRVGIYVVP